MMSRSLKDKSILITGGAGFIGSHLADRIAREHPRRLVVVDNLFLGRKENLNHAHAILGEKFRFCRDDASDFSTMARIIQDNGIEVVYDLAVIPLPSSLENPLQCVLENTRLTTVLCELQRQQRFQTLVHFSSSETYGSAITIPITEDHPYVPSTPYAASKLAGDQVAMSYAHTFGQDITCLRPFNNFGPRQNDRAFAGIIPIVVNCVAKNQPITVNGDGLQTRDYIFVADTAEAAVRIYEEESARGKIINIGSGTEISVLDLIKSILAILERQDHPVFHGPPRPGDVRRHLAGTERANSILSFEPRVDLATGMEATVLWYLSQAKTQS